jgi:hypothetical protein
MQRGESFVSNAVDFDTYDKLGFIDLGESGMYIPSTPPAEKEQG